MGRPLKCWSTLRIRIATWLSLIFCREWSESPQRAFAAPGAGWAADQESMAHANWRADGAQCCVGGRVLSCRQANTGCARRDRQYERLCRSSSGSDHRGHWNVPDHRQIEFTESNRGRTACHCVTLRSLRDRHGSWGASAAGADPEPEASVDLHWISREW
jgi:hypothetical protein